MFRRRWSPRSKVFALLALVGGVASFSLVRGYATKLEALRPEVGSPAPVVVAARDLVRGTVLGEDGLTIAEIPSSFAPPGSLPTLEQVVGRTLVSDLAAGEAVTRTRVGVEGGPVASLVPSGLRAFPIRTDMPAGTVRTGDRVDVIATFGGQRPHTETVATGLEVLTVLEPGEGDAVFGASGAASGPALVLLVGPDVAEQLAYATAFAELAVTIAPAGEVAP